MVEGDDMRFGVVGCGRVFQAYHLPCVRDEPGLTVVAACDAEPGRARGLLGDDVITTADLNDFLDRGRPDIVAVCTPNDTHAEPVLAALAAGAAVLCEKPLAADLQDARRIAAAAPDGPLLGVNLPYRFHELVPVFAELTADGEWGVELVFTTAGQRLWRPVTKWYGDAARAGGGALLDLGPHALDLLQAVFGTPRLGRATIDKPGVEEKASLELAFARAHANVRIDRAARTMALSVVARQGGRELTLDLRRNEIRDGGTTLATAVDPRPELRAVRQFLRAAQGGDGTVVPAADALRLQELVGEVYASAAIMT
jgi:predicted dehydrogenase